MDGADLSRALLSLEEEFLRTLSNSDDIGAKVAFERNWSTTVELVRGDLQSGQLPMATLQLFHRIAQSIFIVSSKISRAELELDIICRETCSKVRSRLLDTGRSSYKPGVLRPRRPTPSTSSSPRSITPPTPSSSSSSPPSSSLLKPRKRTSLCTTLAAERADYLLYAPYRSFFHTHFTYPYPTLHEKQLLISQVPGSDLKKCTTWFENQRKRGSNRSGWGDLVGETKKKDVRSKLESVERGEEGEEKRREFERVKAKFKMEDEDQDDGWEDMGLRNVSGESTSSSLSTTTTSSTSTSTDSIGDILVSSSPNKNSFNLIPTLGQTSSTTITPAEQSILDTLLVSSPPSSSSTLSLPSASNPFSFLPPLPILPSPTLTLSLPLSASSELPPPSIPSEHQHSYFDFLPYSSYEPQEPANDWFETLGDLEFTTDVWQVVGVKEREEERMVDLLGVGQKLARVVL